MVSMEALDSSAYLSFALGFVFMGLPAIKNEVQSLATAGDTLGVVGRLSHTLLAP